MTMLKLLLLLLFMEGVEKKLNCSVLRRSMKKMLKKFLRIYARNFQAIIKMTRH